MLNGEKKLTPEFEEEDILASLTSFKTQEELNSCFIKLFNLNKQNQQTLSSKLDDSIHKIASLESQLSTLNCNLTSLSLENTINQSTISNLSTRLDSSRIFLDHAHRSLITQDLVVDTSLLVISTGLINSIPIQYPIRQLMWLLFKLKRNRAFAGLTTRIALVVFMFMKLRALSLIYGFHNGIGDFLSYVASVSKMIKG